ncbi:hypothetical protein V8G61_08025 [Gaetbulibacter sp. M240]|uniref:hypothetical protein n=1 Tax=Gaetbulibacter sp. M240 TaxID=3126511 RepID=UPI00374E7A42
MDPNIVKKRIKEVLKNADLIIKDNYSYIYLNSERNKEIKTFNLGKGTFVSAISLFALLNLLSKIYTILKNGNKKIIEKGHIEEYEELKTLIKERNSEDWKRIKKYFKKPRIGEINETEAFTELVKDSPIDLGFNKENPQEIRKMWNLFRNKLTHMISLKGNELNGQMLIQTFILGGTYSDNLKFIKSRYPKYPAFDIVNAETKETFKKNATIDSITKQYILKDSCYVDQLKICCELILDWLINEIDSDSFSDVNMKILYDWLESELKSD